MLANYGRVDNSDSSLLNIEFICRPAVTGKGIGVG
jgi:hypothetical protein